MSKNQEKIFKFLKLVKEFEFDTILLPFVKSYGVELLENKEANHLVYKHELMRNMFYIKKNHLVIKVTIRKRKIVLHGETKVSIPLSKLDNKNVAIAIMDYLFVNRNYIETVNDVLEKYQLKSNSEESHFDWGIFHNEVSNDIALGLCPLVKVQYVGGNSIDVISINNDMSDILKIKTYFELFKESLRKKGIYVKFNLAFYDEI